MIASKFSYKGGCDGFYDEKIARINRKFRKILNAKSFTSDIVCNIFWQVSISSITRCNARK